VLISALTAATPAQKLESAQTPQAEEPIRSRTNLVVLDVVVTGRDGLPFGSLQKKDFTVLEDGKPQQIQSVEYTEIKTESKSTALKSVLVLDELNSDMMESAYARAQLAHYLSTQPETLSHPTMLVEVNDDGFQRLAPYTTDRHLLQQALHGIRPGIPFDFNRHDYEARLTITLDVLRQIALANEGAPGRTVLIWLGHGFPSITLTGMEADAAARMQAVAQDITNLLLASRIVIYKVDAAAVGSPALAPNMDDIDAAFDESPEPFADSISFNGIAQQTGGRYYYNRNDVDVELGKAAALGSSYYTIAYKPNSLSTDAAAYRHIRVTVDRPGLKVSTRQGYYHQAPADISIAKTEAIPQVDAAIINNLAYTALGVQVDNLTLSTNGITTHCKLKIDPGTITWKTLPDGSRVAEFFLGAATYTANHKPLTYSRNVAEIRIGANESDSDIALHSNFQFPLHVPPAANTLRVIVLSKESGKLGSAEVTPIPAAAHATKLK
jgi:VWFA-related protein